MKRATPVATPGEKSLAETKGEAEILGVEEPVAVGEVAVGEEE